MAEQVAVVAGYIVRYPVGGMTWVFLNYLLGLRDLGFEPVYVEAAGPQPTCYDVAAGRMTEDPAYGVNYLTESLDAAGLTSCRWWYADHALPGGGVGMAYDEAVATLESASVLINVSASCWAEEFLRAPRRILLDTDAPFTQIRLADGDEGWAAFVDSHDVHATYAVNVAQGNADPEVPDGGRRWLATRPPVDLRAWSAVSPPPDGAWTTVTSWSAAEASWWQLKEYRQKDVEYVRLREIPRLVPDCRFELALGGSAPRRQLAELGWQLADPIEVASTVRDYQEYLRCSRGELGVAKHAYVTGRTGAFNDRSLNYLACGRPVVCSDTGLDWLPTGCGLITFKDAQSAADAIRTAEEDIVAHGRAARQLAEDHFSADAVLASLLTSSDIVLPRRPTSGRPARKAASGCAEDPVLGPE
ncbi:MAG TPA: glycosyltransferase [Acidimicrobiales bacterium]